MSESQRSNTTIDVSKSLRKMADLILGESNPLPPRYLRMGLGAIVRELRRGIPGLKKPIFQARASNLARLAGEYMMAGQYPRAICRILRSLADSPYDPRLWRQCAIQIWDIWDVEGSDLTIEQLEFAIWINPGYQQAKDDLEEIQYLLEDDENDDQEDWARYS